MTDDKKKTEPKKITREEADILNDYAQGLDEPVTHVVDYGEVLEEKDKKDG